MNAINKFIIHEKQCHFDSDRNLSYILFNNKILAMLSTIYCMSIVCQVQYQGFYTNCLIISVPIVASLYSPKLTNEVTKALRIDLTGKFKIRSIYLTIKPLQVLQVYHAWITWPKLLGKWIYFWLAIEIQVYKHSGQKLWNDIKAQEQRVEWPKTSLRSH